MHHLASKNYQHKSNFISFLFQPTFSNIHPPTLDYLEENARLYTFINKYFTIHIYKDKNFKGKHIHNSIITVKYKK